MLKNKIFILMLAMFLAVPTFAEPFRGFNLEELETIDEQVTETGPQQKQTFKENTEVKDVPKTEPAKQNELATKKIPYKKPINKKKVFGKFLFAMFAVGVSSGLIYIFLNVYNKMRDDFGSKLPTISASKQDIGTTLDTPENITDAVRIFIEKTKWIE